MTISPRDYFRESGLRPRKRFGQHFLNQPGTAERIVEAGGLCRSDVVVEVGPGLGALTCFILPRVRQLHLVEVDRDLAAFMESRLAALDSRVFFYQQDILTFDFCDLARREGEALVVLGNLPYNISSPLVFRLLESRRCLKRAVLMVQKEVGERLVAEPGGKAYGVLSVLLGVCAQVRRLLAVGPDQFYPPPKVDSLVVSIEFQGLPLLAEPSFAFLREVVNACFQQRRKTLHNSLKRIGQTTGVPLEAAFLKSGIDSGRRPETLTPREFVSLAEALRPSSPVLQGKPSAPGGA